jgi:hypothetical protein
MRAAIDDTDSTQIAAKDHIAPQRGNLEEEEKGEKKYQLKFPRSSAAPQRSTSALLLRKCITSLRPR